ncbi:phage baseplate assembly protein V [Salinisphaera orenii]|uniref:Gp5/Type VI secretion system Vgr protein OB-fold domain-containing protein n=1 Tax=Salinisphaera orenii YIM 95161 TaxID=1051139 RepID=A0A423PRV3_9GAMM|nr:phage baseplate assembly protein V [Salinisphaera halophila]ROO28282.1 hypothetical protein SAHL_10855 [Salinisphaera halophila YIM 95161]
MPDIETRLADIERRIARMIQTGVIVAADYDAARVRVAIDARTSPWLPWATRRAGPDVDWWAPEVGEQVDLLCPNGEMNGARVIPAFYSDQVPAPANSPAIRLIRFANGTEIVHDRETNRLSIDTPDDIDLTVGGNVTAAVAGNVTETVAGSADLTVQGPASVTAPSGLTITAPLTRVNGALTVTGLLTYSGGLSGSGGSGAAAKIDGDVQSTGRMDADGDVTAGGTSLQQHTHPGDSGGTTGGPK